MSYIYIYIYIYIFADSHCGGIASGDKSAHACFLSKLLLFQECCGSVNITTKIGQIVFTNNVFNAIMLQCRLLWEGSTLYTFKMITLYVSVYSRILITKFSCLEICCINVYFFFKRVLIMLFSYPTDMIAICLYLKLCCV